MKFKRFLAFANPEFGGSGYFKLTDCTPLPDLISDSRWARRKHLFEGLLSVLWVVVGPQDDYVGSQPTKIGNSQCHSFGMTIRLYWKGVLLREHSHIVWQPPLLDISYSDHILCVGGLVAHRSTPPPSMLSSEHFLPNIHSRHPVKLL